MKTYAKYRVIKSQRCPEFKPKKNKTLWFKEFKSGDTVTGYVNNKDVNGVKVVPHIIAQGRWRVPLNSVEKVANVAGETVEANKQIKEIANRKTLSQIVKISQGSINGALIGMAVGWLAAFFLKQNKFVGAFAGSIGGGLIGNAISKRQ